MVFNGSTFLPVSAMANSDAPRQYIYKTTDPIATVKADDYFLTRYQNLVAGDIILVFIGLAELHTLIVIASTSATVTTQISTNQELTTAGAGTVRAGVKSLELNNDTATIAAVIADSKSHQGLFIVKATSEPAGGQDHTVTLTSGTWDGTNDVATFADINDAIAIWFDSAGNGTIVENVGTVGFS